MIHEKRSTRSTLQNNTELGPGICPKSPKSTRINLVIMKGMVALGDTCIIGDCGTIAVLHWSTETCLLVSDSLVKISRDLF